MGTAIPPNKPTSTGGAITLYACDRALPDGLAMDPASGVITGTPTTPTARAVYTITGWSRAGSTSMPLTLGVPGFIRTGNLTQRATAVGNPHSVTVLVTGKVLVTGQVENAPNHGDLYDVAVGRFSRTGTMTVERSEVLATPLPNGKLLIVGGVDASAELYDPSTGLFTATGSMAASREHPTATLLGNGKVLVAGGWYLSSAEVYDPATGLFTPTGNMSRPRRDHIATLLPTGKVLVAGGGDATAELYDPVTGTFTSAGTMATGLVDNFAALLPNGSVLLAGGLLSSIAELYVE